MADPPSVLTLLVKKGPCEGKTLQRRAGAAALRVGRVAKGNHLSVGDAGASQRHLSVEYLPPPAARWAVTDLGSSNGTLLNGKPLTATIPAPLSDGDLIKIGETTVLAVSISTDAGPRPGPAATRRSARNAAAAEAEEQDPAPAVSRRTGRKKAGAAEGPEAGNEVEEEAALPTRRGGRKKACAAEAPETGNEVEEEAALPTRRGERKKAVEPAGVENEAEDEEEEAAIPRRGRSRKGAATVVLPPQPQTTRSTRAAARRGEVLGCEKGEVMRTGRGRGRVTRASASNGTGDTPEEEEEGEVAEARDQEGAAAEGKAEVVPVAGRGRAKRGRGGRGRDRGSATRASTRKAEDTIVENDENEQEERDMADGRGVGESPLRVLAVNDGSEEGKVATEDDKLDGTSKASMEDEKMVDVEEDVTLTERAIEGRVNAQHSPADNGGVEEEEVKNLSKGVEIEVYQELREAVSPDSTLDGVEVDKNDKREASGARGEKGDVGERKGRHRLENMTLGEWFVQIEKYLLAKNEEAAEKAIAEVQEKHRRFCEHVKTLKLRKSPAPSP